MSEDTTFPLGNFHLKRYITSVNVDDPRMTRPKDQPREIHELYLFTLVQDVELTRLLLSGRHGEVLANISQDDWTYGTRARGLAKNEDS
eukprot:scaffold3628_cov112-Cylindrotheca_fusiformis.AAC.2